MSGLFISLLIFAIISCLIIQAWYIIIPIFIIAIIVCLVLQARECRKRDDDYQKYYEKEKKQIDKNNELSRKCFMENEEKIKDTLNTLYLPIWFNQKKYREAVSDLVYSWTYRKNIKTQMPEVFFENTNTNDLANTRVTECIIYTWEMFKDEETKEYVRKWSCLIRSKNNNQIGDFKRITEKTCIEEYYPRYKQGIRPPEQENINAEETITKMETNAKENQKRDVRINGNAFGQLALLLIFILIVCGILAIYVTSK